MFISTAYAQAAGGQDGDPASFIIMMVLLLAVFYFLLIRPQQKRFKEHKAKLEALRRGDKVVIGGIYGTITKIKDTSECTVEIAEGIKVQVATQMIGDVVSKTEPANDGDAKSEDGDNAGDDKKPAGGLKSLFGKK